MYKARIWLLFVTYIIIIFRAIPYVYSKLRQLRWCTYLFISTYINLYQPIHRRHAVWQRCKFFVKFSRINIVHVMITTNLLLEQGKQHPKQLFLKSCYESFPCLLIVIGYFHYIFLQGMQYASSKRFKSEQSCWIDVHEFVHMYKILITIIKI